MGRRSARALTVIVIGSGIGSLASLAAPTRACADAPAGTFSIIGFDPLTREIGVAVQSRAFNVGQAVPWARAGVGAVATQALTNVAHGPRGLALLAAGKPAPEVLRALVASDSGRAHRQIGVMDAAGGCATHTGKECLDWAGGLCEPRAFVCQGNILAGPGVVTAMARAFRETRGELSERLLAALDAAQAAGGDKRGKQSAALLVVRPSATHPHFEERYVDLRVDDHPDPIVELRRLYVIHQGTDLLEAHFTCLEEAQAARDARLASVEKTRIRGIIAAAQAGGRGAGTLNGLAWACATHDLFLDEAVALARRAVALDSTNVDILDTLAEALYRRGDAAEAIAVETRAAEIDPKSAYLKNQIARFRTPHRATR
jgi:uncharacterized Ntn-hydrolase superfamily protein